MRDDIWLGFVALFKPPLKLSLATAAILTVLYFARSGLADIATSADVTGSSCWTGSTILTPSNFSDADRIMDEAKSRIQGKSEEFERKGQVLRVAKFSIFGSEEDRARTLLGKGGFDLGFGEWRQQMAFFAQNPLPLSVTIKLGDTIWTRYYNPSNLKCRSSEKYHSGDKNDFRAGDNRFEILDVAVFCGQADAQTDRIRVYVMTRSPLDSFVGKKVAAKVREKIHGGNIEVLVRNDVWFIDDPTFPVYYRFGSDLDNFHPNSSGLLRHIPEEQSSSPTLDCYSTQSGNFACDSLASVAKPARNLTSKLQNRR